MTRIDFRKLKDYTQKTRHHWGIYLASAGMGEGFFHAKERLGVGQRQAGCGAWRFACGFAPKLNLPQAKRPITVAGEIALELR